MTVKEKAYDQTPAILLNIVNDIGEMWKADVQRLDGERLALKTEMYGIKTAYTLRVVGSPAGTTVTVETEDEDENAERRILLLFATIDHMLSPLLDVTDT